MAFIQEYTCKECGKKSKIAVQSGGIAPKFCAECERKESDIKRIEYFKGLDGLTIEQRLRKVEKWIYDYKAPINYRDVRF